MICILSEHFELVTKVYKHSYFICLITSWPLFNNSWLVGSNQLCLNFSNQYFNPYSWYLLLIIINLSCKNNLEYNENKIAALFELRIYTFFFDRLTSVYHPWLMISCMFVTTPIREKNCWGWSVKCWQLWDSISGTHSPTDSWDVTAVVAWWQCQCWPLVGTSLNPAS